MNAPTIGRRPGAVMFACTHNAIRSPMAEGAARHYFGRHIFLASAGVRRGEMDPFAIAAMDEIGVDIGRHKPRTFDDLEDESFDLIITLSPEAHHAALEMTRTIAVDVEYWATLDPSSIEGSREQRMDAYRDVRDRLIRRITQRLKV